jgi:hypothetical protein
MIFFRVMCVLLAVIGASALCLAVETVDPQTVSNDIATIIDPAIQHAPADPQIEQRIARHSDVYIENLREEYGTKTEIEQLSKYHFARLLKLTGKNAPVETVRVTMQLIHKFDQLLYLYDQAENLSEFLEHIVTKDGAERVRRLVQSRTELQELFHPDWLMDEKHLSTIEKMSKGLPHNKIPDKGRFVIDGRTTVRGGGYIESLELFFEMQFDLGKLTDEQARLLSELNGCNIRIIAEKYNWGARAVDFVLISYDYGIEGTIVPYIPHVEVNQEHFALKSNVAYLLPLAMNEVVAEKLAKDHSHVRVSGRIESCGHKSLGRRFNVTKIERLDEPEQRH